MENNLACIITDEIHRTVHKKIKTLVSESEVLRDNILPINECGISALRERVISKLSLRWPQPPNEYDLLNETSWTNQPVRYILTSKGIAACLSEGGTSMPWSDYKYIDSHGYLEHCEILSYLLLEMNQLFLLEDLPNGEIKVVAHLRIDVMDWI